MSVRGPRKPQRKKYGLNCLTQVMNVIWINLSGHNSKSQKTGFNYARTQVKIAKDGFQLRPDTSHNRKR